MSAGDKLPPKRKLFAEHYVGNGFNGTKAYQAAGYKGDETIAAPEASRLTRNPKVESYLDELIAEAGIAKKLSPEVIKAGIYKAFETAKQKGDVGNMLRAWEMLGRAYAMFKDVSRVEDVRSDELLQQIKGLVSDDVLAQLAEEQGVDPETLGISRH